MILLAVMTVLLLAIVLTCTAGPCGYRNRIRKRHTTPMYTTTPSTTTTLITNTTSATNLEKEPYIQPRHHHPLLHTSLQPTTRMVPDRECILKDGKRLKVGEKYTKTFTGACYVFECEPERVKASIVKCAPPMCVDYVTPDGACCPSCPTGTNCRLQSGEIITHPVVHHGMKCECPTNSTRVFGSPSGIYSTAICTPLYVMTKTTTTTTRTTTPTTTTKTTTKTTPLTTTKTTTTTTPPTTSKTTTITTTPSTTTRTTTTTTPSTTSKTTTITTTPSTTTRTTTTTTTPPTSTRTTTITTKPSTTSRTTTPSTTTRTTTKTSTPPTTTKTTKKPTTPLTTTRTTKITSRTTKTTIQSSTSRWTRPWTSHTLPPYPECILKNGVRLKVGERYTKSLVGACYVFECEPERVKASIVKCAPPTCVDYVTPDGACCPSCPTGTNCELPSGEIITHPVVYNGMKCECPTNRTSVFGRPSAIYYTAICTPLNYMTKTTIRTTTRTTTPATSTKTTTTSTSRTTIKSTTKPSTGPWIRRMTSHTLPPYPECILKNGVRLKVGERYIKSLVGACYVFECEPERVKASIVKCAPPTCVDYVTPDGACCPSCPTGTNCRLPSGKLITHPVVHNGMKCECPTNRTRVFGSTSGIYSTAICTPLHDMTKTTTGSTKNTISTTRSPTPSTRTTLRLTTFRTSTRSTPRISITTYTNTTKHPCPTKNASVPHCITKTGKLLEVGEKYIKSFPGACYIFVCTPGQLVTKTVTCKRPMCVDYVTPAGACCPSCPRGRNCRLPSGEIISHPVVRHGKKCECPTKRKLPGGRPSAYNTAICRPLIYMEH